MVKDTITSTSCEITQQKGMEYDYASNTAALIRGGALPVSLEEVTSSVQTATIGADALSKSVLAGVIGLALVFILMILIYNVLGIMADIALALYVLIDLWLMVSFPDVKTNKATRELFTVNLDGSGRKQITDTESNEYAPAWMADGKRIAFMSNEGGSMQLWVMNADGTERRQLSNIEGGITGFLFFPDEKQVLFTKDILTRSEESRVGKECRSRWSPYH